MRDAIAGTVISNVTTGRWLLATLENGDVDISDNLMLVKGKSGVSITCGFHLLDVVGMSAFVGRPIPEESGGAQVWAVSRAENRGKPRDGRGRRGNGGVSQS